MMDGWIDGSATTYVELVDLMKPRSANAWHGMAWYLGIAYLHNDSVTHPSVARRARSRVGVVSSPC